MNWQSLLEFLGGATALSLTFGYLGKKAIEAYVAGRIESYKSDLQQLATEHSVRFQRLHGERAEIIKDLYAKVAVLDDTLHSTLRPLQLVGESPMPDKVSRLSAQFNELREYFLPRRIFFDKSVCKVIDTLLENAKGIFYDITTYEVDPTHEEYKGNRDALRERREFWEKARTTHKQEFAAIKTLLEAEFRAILGLRA